MLTLIATPEDQINPDVTRQRNELRSLLELTRNCESLNDRLRVEMHLRKLLNSMSRIRPPYSRYTDTALTLFPNIPNFHITIYHPTNMIQVSDKRNSTKDNPRARFTYGGKIDIPLSICGAYALWRLFLLHGDIRKTGYCV